ncbi:hypothetical protein SKAU_G00175490 [Synaphobranchus kaupii]|uniref:Uncharacterized protein n=1 Tax=Synaphobranchus kaupii TaxID=118154 RepID=A0A9Q1FLA0_SYNKA|nr:hypothetical protein SKAU_G00175490 [Synaphobranchus kaupii]
MQSAQPFRFAPVPFDWPSVPLLRMKRRTSLPIGVVVQAESRTSVSPGKLRAGQAAPVSLALYPDGPAGFALRYSLVIHNPQLFFQLEWGCERERERVSTVQLYSGTTRGPGNELQTSVSLDRKGAGRLYQA